VPCLSPSIITEIVTRRHVLTTRVVWPIRTGTDGQRPLSITIGNPTSNQAASRLPTSQIKVLLAQNYTGN
jgi:hypothetical protein